MTTPKTLLLRLALCALVVLFLAHIYQHDLLAIMLPLISHTLAAVLNEFTIQSLTIDAQSGMDLLRLRTDLAVPLWVNNLELQPLDGQGWYEVTMTVGGVLQYAVCMLIVAFTWPAVTWRYALQRLLIAMPLAIGLTLLNVAITLPAELWSALADQWLPGKTWLLLTLSRIMMGGGGLILAMLLGAFTAYLTRPQPSLAAAAYPSTTPSSTLIPLRSSEHHDTP